MVAVVSNVLAGMFFISLMTLVLAGVLALRIHAADNPAKHDADYEALRRSFFVVESRNAISQMHLTVILVSLATLFISAVGWLALR